MYFLQLFCKTELVFFFSLFIYKFLRLSNHAVAYYHVCLPTRTARVEGINLLILFQSLDIYTKTLGLKNKKKKRKAKLQQKTNSILPLKSIAALCNGFTRVRIRMH